MKPSIAAMTMAAALSLAGGTASAQQRMPGEEPFWSLVDQIKQVPPLKFEAGMKERAGNPNIKNQLVTPPGKGPFPAVVLMPSCGGVNEALEARAKELLDANYAVLAVDSYGPRGKNWRDCGPMFLVVMNDAFHALKHLHTIEAVDKKRTFVAGWSTGAAGALLGSSPHGSKEGGTDLRYTAAVTHYANCKYQEAPKSLVAPVLRQDTDRPLLVLIAETDVPVSNCFPMLEEMKSAGKPVEWHVIKGSAHLWDRPDDTRGSRENGFGQKITLRYSPDATREATQRMVDFFNRFK